jgi:hypothetical protein
MKLHKGRENYVISGDGADGRREPTRFHLIDVLPKDSKFNAGHYIFHILSPLPKFLLLIKMSKGDILWFAANARPHYAKTVTQFLDHNSRRRADHPPYSPDLALHTSNFQVSESSASSEFIRPTWWTLVRYPGKFERLNRETLDAVFQEWMIRLQNCIDENGEYVERCSNWNVQFLFLNGKSWDARLRRTALP